jgi:hypothetical protein
MHCWNKLFAKKYRVCLNFLHIFFNLQSMTRQATSLNAAKAVAARNYASENNFSAVNEVKKWKEMMGEVAGRHQTPTAATGCCGYSGVKQSLGIPDVRQVMIDIKHQIEVDMEKNTRNGNNVNAEMRDLHRVKCAIQQVDHKNIGEPGWFSDFLAVYVARVYGVTVLIIRESGIFTFIQVVPRRKCTFHCEYRCVTLFTSLPQNDGKMGNISAREFPNSCDEHSFDIVLGSDGDCTALNSGTHWDCWIPVTSITSRKQIIYDHSKLGKHLGSFSWRAHLLWLDPVNSIQVGNPATAPVVDLR